MADITIKPVVIPAKPEKTYSKGWVTQLIISSPTPSDKIKLVYSINPYDGVDVLKQPTQRVIPDIKELMKTSPKLSACYDALLEAISEYENKQ